MQLLTSETSEFAPTLWPVNGPDLSPEDYRIWGKLQEHVYCSWIHNAVQLKLHLIEDWEHFKQMIINEAVSSRIRARGTHLQTCLAFTL